MGIDCSETRKTRSFAEQMTTTSSDSERSNKVETKMESQRDSKVERIARFVIDMASPNLDETLGFKTAWKITSIILILDIVFVTAFTITLSRSCKVQTQTIDASMWEKSNIADEIAKRHYFTSERWYLCSSRQMSFRSQLFSLGHLQELENLGLPDDDICHLTGQRSSHAVLQVNSSAPDTAPDMLVHDLTSIEFYPCMFEGMSCDDYGSMSECGDELAYPIVKGCDEKLIEDWTSSPTSRPKGVEFDKYDCGPENKIHGDPEHDLHDLYRHFGSCKGLISVTMNVCPNIAVNLGSAFGYLMPLNSCIVALIMFFAISFKEDHDGEKPKRPSETATTL